MDLALAACAERRWGEHAGCPIPGAFLECTARASTARGPVLSISPRRSKWRHRSWTTAVTRGERTTRRPEWAYPADQLGCQDRARQRRRGMLPQFARGTGQVVTEPPQWTGLCRRIRPVARSALPFRPGRSGRGAGSTENLGQRSPHPRNASARRAIEAGRHGRPPAVA
jgi:hypothetical protein